jgi:DNA-binding PadR family transcriptional regulator
MRKDWVIIRQILLRLEEASTPNTFLRAKDFDAFSEQEVAYNMRLLKEAGYIEAIYQESRTGSNELNAAMARRLTNSGHELLDTIRNDSIWSKIKETFRSKGVEMTFDLVIAVGKKIGEQALDL